MRRVTPFRLDEEEQEEEEQAHIRVGDAYQATVPPLSTPTQSVDREEQCVWSAAANTLPPDALKRYLEAWQQAKARGRIISDHDYAPEAGSRVSHADLNAYARIGQPTGHGVRQ